MIGVEEQMLTKHSESVSSVKISCDGVRVVSFSGEETLKVWNLKAGIEERMLKGLSFMIWTDAISDENPLNKGKMVSVSDYGVLKVRNLEAGTEEETLPRHSSWVRAVAVSRDGKRAVSAAVDLSLKVWNLEMGAEIVTFDLDQPPRCLAIGRDGMTIVVGDQAGQVFWLALRGG
jgi:WD40 repeat protein